MAKLITVGMEEELEKLELQLSKLGDLELAKELVMAGAQPVADEIRKRINRLPEDDFRLLRKDEKFSGVPKSQKQDLLDSLGIAPPDISRNGDANTKIGFDGYGTYKTKKYPQGLPNPLLARAIESGSTIRKKTPFIRTAVNATNDKAIRAMQDKLIEKIEEIKKG